MQERNIEKQGRNIEIQRRNIKTQHRNIEIQRRNYEAGNIPISFPPPTMHLLSVFCHFGNLEIQGDMK